MELTSQQQKAAAHDKGPALVLAVPGSGKTTMLLHRTHNLIKEGIDSDKILTITFSRTAARDLKTKYQILFPEARNIPQFSTIHSFCYSIIRSYERVTGKKYTIIEGKNPSKYKILRTIYIEVNKSYPNDDQLETLLREISLVKNKILAPKQFSKSQGCHTKNFFEIFSQYQSLKKEKNWIDYDDMVSMGRQIVLTDKNLRDNIRRTYPYVQIDEGQDTSREQMDVIHNILGREKNLFIVADDDQSIYGFRGADPSGLFALRKIYPNLSEYYLTTNFRSTENIVRLTNSWIAQNKNRFQKSLQPHYPKAEEPKFLPLNSLAKQYDFILQKWAEGHLGETAILYRNHTSALGLIEIFERENIPFQVKDTKISLLYHWIYRDLMNILAFSKDPSRGDLYEKFYYKLTGYISKKNIEDIKKKGYAQNVFSQLLTLTLPLYMQKNIRALKRDFDYLATLPLHKAIQFIEYDLGYRDYISKFSKTYGSNLQLDMEILYYLKLMAKELKNPVEFEGRVKYLENYLQDRWGEKDSIFLTTIHGAKGLEFDTVFIIDVVENILPLSPPSYYSNEEKRELLEEERRLFYVALSRAKKNLYVLAPKTINHMETHPSEFFLWQIKRDKSQ